MTNIKLTLEYDGTLYKGWQIQKGDLPTVQGELKKSLDRITREETKPQGAGRTDSGVHATGQVANVRIEKDISGINFKAALNTMLPSDIAVREVEEVPEDFHAMFSAKSKIYRYYIVQGPHRIPLLRNKALVVPYALDFENIDRVLKVLEGEKDFKSFQAQGTDVKTTVRKILFARMLKFTPPHAFPWDIHCLEISGTGFLKQMVRNIVGTLLEAGRGKLSVADVERILEARDRTQAPATAAAHGLYLSEVKY